MATLINLSDLGYYQESHKGGFGSRVWAGAFGSFSVSRINPYYWNCRLSGHSNHTILAVLSGGGLYADCDCYDFQHYGKPYKRACYHIWNIYFHEDIYGF